VASWLGKEMISLLPPPRMIWAATNLAPGSSHRSTPEAHWYVTLTVTGVMQQPRFARSSVLLCVLRHDMVHVEILANVHCW